MKKLFDGCLCDTTVDQQLAYIEGSKGTLANNRPIEYYRVVLYCTQFGQHYLYGCSGKTIACDQRAAMRPLGDKQAQVWLKKTQQMDERLLWDVLPEAGTAKKPEGTSEPTTLLAPEQGPKRAS